MPGFGRLKQVVSDDAAQDSRTQSGAGAKRQTWAVVTRQGRPDSGHLTGVAHAQMAQHGGDRQVVVYDRDQIQIGGVRDLPRIERPICVGQADGLVFDPARDPEKGRVRPTPWMRCQDGGNSGFRIRKVVRADGPQQRKGLIRRGKDGKPGKRPANVCNEDGKRLRRIDIIAYLAGSKVTAPIHPHRGNPSRVFAVTVNNAVVSLSWCRAQAHADLEQPRLRASVPGPREIGRIKFEENMGPLSTPKRHPGKPAQFDDRAGDGGDGIADEQEDGRFPRASAQVSNRDSDPDLCGRLDDVLLKRQSVHFE